MHHVSESEEEDKIIDKMAKMEFWNARNLEPPPLQLCKVNSYSSDLPNLFKLLVDGSNLFNNQPLLNWEAALLSRLIYRNKLMFHSDKGFQTMEKINRSLRVYLGLDLLPHFQQIISITPRDLSDSMPCRESLDYILVRIQGASKILGRIVQTCKIAVTYHRFRLNLGHFWKYSLIGMAVISRIWGLCRHLLKNCYELYDLLLPFRKQLTCAIQWLPDHYTFPSSLEEFVGVNLQEEDEAILLKKQPLPTPNIFVIDDSDSEIEFCGEYFDLDLECGVQVEKYIDMDHGSLQKIIENEDLGEEVIRRPRGKRAGKKRNRRNRHKMTEMSVISLSDEDPNISDESVICLGS